MWSQAISKTLGYKYGKAFVKQASNVEQCRNLHVNEELIRCVQDQCSVSGFGNEGKGFRLQIGTLG